MTTFYNEWDTKTAAWLRELARQGHVTEGIVDERSIKDIQPDDVREYKRCHFFAGIGGWDYALNLAGFPDDRAVWTGSCPCQPFSSAGKRQGQADERHLWPDWFRLIRECRPDTIIGEQVASAIGHGWLDGVFADLEGIGYTCGAVVLGAHSVGAPHIRQRLWWCASRRLGNTNSEQTDSAKSGQSVLGAGRDGVLCGLAESSNERYERGGQARRGRAGLEDDGEHCGLGITRRDGSQGECEAGAACGTVERACAVGGVEYNQVNRLQEHDQVRGFAGTGCGDGGVDDTKGVGRVVVQPANVGAASREKHASANTGDGGDGANWAGSILIPCGDGKTRRLEPGTSPLVDGVPARVVRLRGYGNAIVPACAAAFIRAFMDCEKA